MVHHNVNYKSDGCKKSQDIMNAVLQDKTDFERFLKQEIENLWKLGFKACNMTYPSNHTGVPLVFDVMRDMR